MDSSSFKSLDSASTKVDMVCGLRRFSKGSFHLSLISSGLQIPTQTKHSLGQDPISFSETPNSLPEPPQGQLKVIHQGILQFLPYTSFCIFYHQSHSPSCHTVPVICFLSPLQTPMTFRPHIFEAASTIYSDSMSSNAPGTCEKLLEV